MENFPTSSVSEPRRYSLNTELPRTVAFQFAKALSGGEPVEYDGVFISNYQLAHQMNSSSLPSKFSNNELIGPKATEIRGSFQTQAQAQMPSDHSMIVSSSSSFSSSTSSNPISNTWTADPSFPTAPVFSNDYGPFPFATHPQCSSSWSSVSTSSSTKQGRGLSFNDFQDTSLQKVLRYLDAKTMERMMLVDKRLARIIQGSEEVWQRLCRRDFPAHTAGFSVLFSPHLHPSSMAFYLAKKEAAHRWKFGTHERRPVKGALSNLNGSVKKICFEPTREVVMVATDKSLTEWSLVDGSVLSETPMSSIIDADTDFRTFVVSARQSVHTLRADPASRSLVTIATQEHLESPVLCVRLVNGVIFCARKSGHVNIYRVNEPHLGHGRWADTTGHGGFVPQHHYHYQHQQQHHHHHHLQARGGHDAGETLLDRLAVPSDGGYGVEEMAVIPAHKCPIYSFDIHGERMVTSGSDRLIRLWDWTRPEKNFLQVFRGHTHAITCIAFLSPSSSVPPFGVPTNPLSLSSSSSSSSSSSFTSSSSLVVPHPLSYSSSSSSSSVMPLFAQTSSSLSLSSSGMMQHHYHQQQQQTVPGTGPWPHTAASQMLSSSKDGTIRLWDIEKGTQPRMMSHSRVSVNCFQAHGFHVVAGDSERKVTIWDLRAPKPTTILKGHTSQVTSVYFDEFRIFSGDASGGFNVWDLANPRHIFASLRL